MASSWSLIKNGLHVASEPVKLVVGSGSDQDELHVHHELLRSSSEFFQRALSPSWKEGTEGVITLPDHDIKVVTIYVQWLYSNQFFVRESMELGSQTYDWDLWGQIYEFGSYIQDTKFRNAVIDLLTDAMKHSGHYPLNTASMIYPNSSKGSNHRRLVVETAAYTIMARTQLTKMLESEDAPYEFLTDLLLYIAPRLKQGVPDQPLERYLAAKTRMEYHEPIPTPRFTLQSFEDWKQRSQQTKPSAS